MKNIFITLQPLNSISLQCRSETILHIITDFSQPVSDYYNSVLTEAYESMKNHIIKSSNYLSNIF